MARELGGALCRTPARAPPTSGIESDENAPAGGASDAERSIPARMEQGAASRPPLRAIQPPSQPRWLVPTPKKSLGARAAGKTPAPVPARVGAGSTSLGPTKSLRKPLLRLGFPTAGASSTQPPRSKVQDAILFWEASPNAQNVLPTVQRDDSHAPAKIENCSDEGFMRNSEDILSLQLELEIIKTILVEKNKAQAEAEVRATALGDELKAANLHILEACRQNEATKRELNDARSVIDALESQQIILINELDELKKNNFQSPVFLKKRELNSELGVHLGKEYVLYEEPYEDSSLSIKLQRVQDSLEKAHNLNTRYQRDQASRNSVEQEQDEVRRQVEIEMADVIISLTKDLSSLQQQLDSCNKTEFLAKQNLDETQRIELLLDESIETLVQKEVLEQNYVSSLRRMEEEICQLESQLGQSKRCYEGRLKELEIKMQEMDDEVAAPLIPWNKEKEIAEERKIYAEKKNEVKLLERSIEDLEITVCSLENKVELFKEEAEQQRKQREKLEVELQNVRQQLLAVPSPEKAERSLEDRMVDLPDSTRHPSYINNELAAQESRRIGRKEFFEKESEIFGPVQEGPTSSTIRHGRNMGMLPLFEEQMQGKYASSASDIFKETADVSLPDSHALPHVTNQRKPNTNPVAGEVELAPLVEHSKEPGEPSSDEYMQDAGQSDVEMAKVHSSDNDYWLESSEFEEPSAIEQLEQSSANKQPELYGSGADSDQSLSELESEEQVPLPAEEPMVEVLKENEMPPVASVRPNYPVNYVGAPSDELKKLRSRTYYEGQRTATDRRFWSIEQQDLYNSIYSRSNLFDMKWIDWEHIDSKEQFAGVREQCAHLGLEQIMSYHCDWDNELIRQFYSTVHISADKSSITWMTDGRRVSMNKRAWEEWFGIPAGVHTEIHSQFLLDDDGKRILYTSAKSLTPLASVANKILRTTIYPRSGSTIHTHNWNLLCHTVKQQSFDVIALIFGEIDLLISERSRTKDKLLYAPYIMGMILRAFEYDGPRESRHHSYKPRDSYKAKPKRTKEVSCLAAHSVAASFQPPPSAFQPGVAAAGHDDAHAEAGDGHHQFEAAGHQPQVAEAVQRQAVLPQPITRTDLLQVVEDGLRPIRDSLASMEGRIGRVEGGDALLQRDTNSSSSSQIPGPTTSSSPSCQATNPAPPPAPAASSEQASSMHADNAGASARPALVRPSPFSRFPWYQNKQ